MEEEVKFDDEAEEICREFCDKGVEDTFGCAFVFRPGEDRFGVTMRMYGLDDQGQIPYPMWVFATMMHNPELIERVAMMASADWDEEHQEVH